MSRITVAQVASTLDTFMSAQSEINKANAASMARIEALLTDSSPAKSATKTVTTTSTVPSGKVFRSAKGKEQAKADVAQAWSDAKAKAGVKRVSELSTKQRAAVDAQVKAIWASVPKTRTTKA